MRFEGRLSTWVALRGCGSIAPLAGGDEVFVHVSAFPADGQQPQLGELLSFELHSDVQGRKQAVRVQRLKQRSTGERMPTMPAARPGARLQGAAFHQRKQLQRRLRWATACAAVLLALGTVVWLDLSRADAVSPSLHRLASTLAH